MTMVVLAGVFELILNTHSNGLRAILIARRAKGSYETGICDSFPYQSQMQQRRQAMIL